MEGSPELSHKLIGTTEDLHLWKAYAANNLSCEGECSKSDITEKEGWKRV